MHSDLKNQKFGQNGGGNASPLYDKKPPVRRNLQRMDEIEYELLRIYPEQRRRGWINEK